MYKKVLALTLCLIFVFQLCALADFKDIENHWAKKEISEMVSKKIINGYDSNTFAPEDSVKRVDALLLASRIIGASDPARTDFAEAALSEYDQVLSVLKYKDYNLTLAFLLYSNIYTTSELQTFLLNDIGNQPLKRHEAAVILTKIMGAEETVKSNSMPVLSYSDSASIPATSKAYVEYCTEQQLMQGMDENNFGPLVEVTRAQMATMLYRVMNKLSLSSSSGVVTNVNTISNSVQYSDVNGNEKTVNVLDNVFTKKDGKTIYDLEGIKPGDEINVVFKGSSLYMVEFISTIADETVTGVVKSKSIGSSVKKITVIPSTDSTTSNEYVLSDNCTVVIGGEVKDLSNIVNSDYVTVTVRNGKATYIVVENKEKTVTGVISEFIYEAPSKMAVKLANNTVETYELSTNVDVTKNGKSSEVTALMVGDKVTVKTSYDKITSVVATSTTKTVEGTIEEIHISKSPSIKIATPSGDLECALNRSDLTITVNDQDADIYDLKLGFTAKVTLESSTIKSISISSVATVDTVNVVGTVTYVDTNYNYIKLTVADGSEDQIFVKKNTTIIDSATQKAKTLSNITVGSTITAVVESSAFTKEAISIVILTTK